MNTKSLKFRLVAWYAGWLAILFVVFAVFVYDSLRHYLRKSVEEALARRTRQIAEMVQRAPQTWDSASHPLPAAFASEANNRFTRITVNGRVRYQSGAPFDGSFNPATVPPAAHTAAQHELFEYRSLPDGGALYVSVLTRRVNGQWLVVEEGFSAAPIKNTLHSWLMALLVGLVGLTCAAVAGGFVAVQRALTPVDEIIRLAEHITLRNLNARLPVTRTEDEIERLATALNNMIDRLEKSFDHTKRFLADASHELRTPVTIIEAELDALTRSEAMPLPLVRRAESALEETERLRRIVHALFALTRLEVGEAMQEFSPVDAGELAQVATEQMRMVGEEKQIAMTCTAAANVIVRGDASRLKQVILNLLDNAIKYTAPGGAIHVSVEARGGNAVLQVRDNGIGIPSAALPHVFERFFRVDKARSRELGGAGLGLAIVKAICTAHNGTVRVTSRENAGSEFTIELPLVKPAMAARETVEKG